MSKVTHITSTAQFKKLLAENTYVVADFHAQWCGPCHAIAPFYEQLATAQSAAGKMAFVKIDVDQQQELARTYSVSAMPTFLVFKNGNQINNVRGANPPALRTVVSSAAAVLAKEAATPKPNPASEPDNNTSASNNSGEEEKTVSGGYTMSSGSNWRMAL